jgi:nucleoside-diphosphate-sugar epimerase
VPVFAAVRRDISAPGVRLVAWADASGLPQETRLLHSIPPLPPEETDALHKLIEELQPVRVVYISSSGVYGAEEAVNEASRAAPSDARGEQRLAEEAWVSSGAWSSAILRHAAIYGPGRGIHTAFREGRAPRSSGVVSRIHVDDLAAITDAALFSDIEGAWPVADDLPCSSAEIIDSLAQTREIRKGHSITGRRVDGRKIRELLNVKLRYPSWKTGIPACLREEENG